MSDQISIHYFQTEDEEWLCAVQEPFARNGAALGDQFRELAKAGSDPLPGEGDEHLMILARIAIHHAMRQLGESEREFKLEFLPPVVKLDAPASGMGASILNLFEGVTVWRQAD